MPDTRFSLAALFTTALAVAAPASAQVNLASRDALVEFRYAWPTEARVIRPLDARFRADAARQKRDALTAAQADRRARLSMKAPFNRHYFMRVWSARGQSARLLSLESQTDTFTGGAHPMSSTGALLWDRALGRAVTHDSLLQRAGGWSAAIRKPFCNILDKERARRRGGPVRRGDSFGACPALKDLTVSLQDGDRDRRFDRIRVIADPYVAGPYAEGKYVISIPVTAAMVARLKPAFRASFEAQRARQ